MRDLTTQDMPTRDRRILFSPPDVGEEEAEAVAEALRSGWITTGPRTKELERRLAVFTQADSFACLSSATAALECCLRALGIGPGDEVITSAYTYTASCSVICHVGATPVLCDVAPGSFEMDYGALPSLVTERTKAVIPVDIGGRMCDYERLFEALDSVRDRWSPANEMQRCFDRVIVLADAAHSLGATYRGGRLRQSEPDQAANLGSVAPDDAEGVRAAIATGGRLSDEAPSGGTPSDEVPSGSVADFTAFSFHAVKNFTTAEGGGLAWRSGAFSSEEFYRTIMLLSLHGQNKDALAKDKAGAWEYDILFPGWKCNMTDIQAALGLVQLDRYPALLERRRELVSLYEEELRDCAVSIMPHYDERGSSSGHLLLTRIKGASASERNAVIERLAGCGVASNVHYKPLPLLTAYRNLGFDIADFPNAFAQYENEITLPLHTKLADDDVRYVCDTLRSALREI